MQGFADNVSPAADTIQLSHNRVLSSIKVVKLCVLNPEARKPWLCWSAQLGLVPKGKKHAGPMPLL